MCTPEMIVAGVQTGMAKLQIDATNDAAKAGYDATQRNVDRAEAANARQAAEVNEQTVEAETDRYRQANREIGALRVAMGELGVGSSSRTALVRRQGGIAGLDIRRIRKTGARQLDALYASNLATRDTAQDQVDQIYRGAKLANINTVVNTIMTPLQIVSGGMGRSAQTAAAGNKT